MRCVYSAYFFVQLATPFGMPLDYRNPQTGMWGETAMQGKSLSCVSAGGQEGALQASGQQTPPGLISLELFGMDDTEDEPLTLPVQATTTALPTPPLNSHTDNGMLSLTGMLAYGCSLNHAVNNTVEVCML